MPQLSTAIFSATETATIAAVAADVDLVALRPSFSKTSGGDGAELCPRMLYIHGSGTLVLEYRSGNTDSFPVTAPYKLPVQATKVLAATTCTNIVCMY